MTKILVTAELHPEGLRSLAGLHVMYHPGTVVTSDNVDLLNDVTGWLIPHTQRVSADILSAAKGLRALSTVSAGVDHIDTEESERRGIRVLNTAGVTSPAVAELTLGLLIILARDVVRASDYVQNGGWRAGPLPLGQGLVGQTLGILGFGDIGRTIARLAHEFGMNVIYHARSVPTARFSAGPTWVPRQRLFADSDFLVVAASLNPTTRASVGAEEFEEMKRSSFIINIARGAIIDEPALVVALDAGLIAGAALDVLEEEPMVANHPLRGRDNVLLLPHMGGATAHTRRAMQDVAIHHLIEAVIR